MAQLAPKLAAGSPLLPTSPQTPQEAEQVRQAQRDPHDDPLKCTESVYMSFFFDGTRNNKEADMPLQRYGKVTRLAQWLRRCINSLRPTLQATGIALLLVSLAACSQPAAEAPSDSMGLGVGLLNYSDIPTGPVYVDGDWAGGVRSHGGGGLLPDSRHRTAQALAAGADLPAGLVG